jgi:hypothetical protein
MPLAEGCCGQSSDDDLGYAASVGVLSYPSCTYPGFRHQLRIYNLHFPCEFFASSISDLLQADPVDPLFVPCSCALELAHIPYSWTCSLSADSPLGLPRVPASLSTAEDSQAP